MRSPTLANMGNAKRDSHSVKFKKKSAISKAHEEFYLSPDDVYAHDLELAIESLLRPIVALVKKSKNAQPPNYAFKFHLKFEVKLEKYSFENGKTVRIQSWFPADVQVVLTKGCIRQKIIRALQSAIQRYDTFIQRGSGWSIDRVMTFSISIMKYKLFTGGCSRKKLPPHIGKLRAVLSVQGVDNDRCFLYAVAASIAKVKRNASRICKKYNDIIALLPTALLEYPVSLASIELFEKKVPSISINVFGFDKQLYPYRVSNNLSAELHADLLYHEGHYYAIRNMGRLVTKGESKTNERKTYVCAYCLSYFVNIERFQLHKEMCTKDCQKFKLPPVENNMFAFKDYSTMIENPFVVFADLETCVLPPQPVNKGKKISSRTHIPISAAALTVCRIGSQKGLSLKPFVATGEDCIFRLLEYLEQTHEDISLFLAQVNVPMVYTKQDAENFVQATRCHMCRKSFSQMHVSDKVRDHCHLTGRYRYALCTRCNLAYAKPSNKLCVFFHGLANYDSHFLVAALGKYKERLSINIIPKNTQKYLSFSLNGIQFKDSYEFMNGSLSQLVTILRGKGEKNFHHVRRHIKEAHLREHFYRKGIFPYSYMSSPAVLQQKSLPAKECFYDELSRKHVSDKDYAFAQSVWRDFGCTTMRDYMEVYLVADTLLLADCYENFRDICIHNYELDPSYYFSNPHFSLSAFLRKGEITMELLTDINMYLFFSKGIRGGVSMVSGRYAEANNKHIPNCDVSKKSVYILNLDCTNLYGTSMMDYLPYGSFRWLPDSELDVQKILATPVNSDVGYVLECSLQYPRELHDLHSDYPLAPVKRKILHADLSPYANSILKKLHNRHVESEKLTLTLEDKDNYILHYRNLQLYLSLGLVLKQVHRVVAFKQKPIIKSYIEFNSRQRAAATNKFDQDYFKLMCNSLYGKTMERPDKRRRINLVTDIRKYEKRVSSLNFMSCKVINKDIVAIESKHECLHIVKPIYLGFTILELAKAHMYDFYYNVLKVIYPLPGQLRLLYTDTDSLLVEICTDDLFDDMKRKFPPRTFDFSNYPKGHELYDERYKRVPGTFKDECGSKMITKFVGLRSKMYAYSILDRDPVKIAKGVKKGVVANNIKFEEYENCLKNNVETSNEFSTIQSLNHSVFTVLQHKKSLSPFDDKRYILSDGLRTVPYGHYMTRKRRAETGSVLLNKLKKPTS